MILAHFGSQFFGRLGGPSSNFQSRISTCCCDALTVVPKLLGNLCCVSSPAICCKTSQSSLASYQQKNASYNSSTPCLSASTCWRLFSTADVGDIEGRKKRGLELEQIKNSQGTIVKPWKEITCGQRVIVADCLLKKARSKQVNLSTR